jgi:hypothetical protein
MTKMQVKTEKQKLIWVIFLPFFYIENECVAPGKDN